MRLVNRPLAVILAAALAVAAIIVIIEVIALAVHHGPLVLHWTTWYRWARKTRWDQLVIQVWSAVLIVIGAAILALELKPRRVTRLPLRSGHDATRRRGDPPGPGRGPAGSGDRGRRGLRRRGHRPPPPRPRHRHRRRPGPDRHRSAPATCHPGAAGPAGRPGPAPPAAPPRARQLPEPLMHADRTNRVGLILFGLLVLAVGAAGMIASTGVSGTGVLAAYPVRQPRQHLHRPPRLGVVRRRRGLPGDHPARAALDRGPAHLHRPGRRHSHPRRHPGGDHHSAARRAHRRRDPGNRHLPRRGHRPGPDHRRRRRPRSRHRRHRQPDQPTCAPSTSASKPKPSATSGTPSATPACPSSSTSTSAAGPPSRRAPGLPAFAAARVRTPHPVGALRLMTTRATGQFRVLGR